MYTMEGSETGNLVPQVIRTLIYDFDDTIVESERINDMLFSGFIHGIKRMRVAW